MRFTTLTEITETNKIEFYAFYDTHAMKATQYFNLLQISTENSLTGTYNRPFTGICQVKIHY